MNAINFENAHHPKWSPIATSMTRDYFYWMNGEIHKTCHFSIQDIVGMSLDQYIETATNIICPQDQPEAKFYLLIIDNQAVAMGGIRSLKCGDAEIVRIYARPEHRGKGYGNMMMQKLIHDARLAGFNKVKLDTGIFMKSAQKYIQR